MKNQRTTTVTFSMPVEDKEFYQEMSVNGYNRSYNQFLLTKVLRILYEQSKQFPGGLIWILKVLAKTAHSGELMRFLKDRKTFAEENANEDEL